MPCDRKTSEILIVEDSDVDFLSLKRAFAKLGYTGNLARCSDGDEALHYLGVLDENAASRGALPYPCLILLDLNMPGRSGLEVLDTLKNSRYRSTPIVVMTSSSDPNDIRHCYLSGCNAYIQKPIDSSQMAGIISAFRRYWLETVLLPEKTAV